MLCVQLLGDAAVFTMTKGPRRAGPLCKFFIKRRGVCILTAKAARRKTRKAMRGYPQRREKRRRAARRQQRSLGPQTRAALLHSHGICGAYSFGAACAYPPVEHTGAAAYLVPVLAVTVAARTYNISYGAAQAHGGQRACGSAAGGFRRAAARFMSCRAPAVRAGRIGAYRHAAACMGKERADTGRHVALRRCRFTPLSGARGAGLRGAALGRYGRERGFRLCHKRLYKGGHRAAPDGVKNAVYDVHLKPRRFAPVFGAAAHNIKYAFL